MSGTHRYALFGLVIESALSLPELRQVESPGPPDVTVDFGPVAESKSLPRAAGLSRGAPGGVLEVPEVGRYGIAPGAITIDRAPSATERNLRLFLLGSAIGALLHQRGILPLHANAVDMGGFAVAFVGQSGAGKSTLAAAFHDAGHPLLSDDICVVTPAASGFEVQPGIPRVRLWRDAVERSGRDAETLDAAFDGMDKYIVPTLATQAEAPLPLGAIYILENGGLENGDGADFAIRPLGASAGLPALVHNTYRGAFVPILGDPQRHFQTCLTLARTVPVFALSRPWDVTRIGETVERIGAHLTALRDQ
jgi:hypothetical protein